MRLFDEIKLKFEEKTTILCDNRQTISLLQKDTPKLVTKLKHVDIHQHWLRQEVQLGNLKLEWIPTMDMPADGFTKPLPRQRHEMFVDQLNLVDIHDRMQQPLLTVKAGGVCQI